MIIVLLKAVKGTVASDAFQSLSTFVRPILDEETFPKAQCRVFTHLNSHSFKKESGIY